VRLADAMIFVAATATASWANRRTWRDLHRWPYHPDSARVVIDHILVMVAPHLVALTIAWLVARLRRPRPPLRRLVRRPGTVACLVALASLLVIVLWAATTLTMGSGFGRGYVVAFGELAVRADRQPTIDLRPGIISGSWLFAYMDRVSFAIAGAWLQVWLSRRWRPEPTGFDRLGRAIGWLWIGFALAKWLRCYGRAF
jgi:hypothetical protein